jgi:hypothetical protein
LQQSPGEHGQHHAPGWGRGIGPRLGQAAQARTGGLDALGNVQQVAGTPGQSVEPGHGHNVTGSQMIEQAGQLRAVAPGAGDLLGVNTGAASRVQLGPLVG